MKHPKKKKRSRASKEVNGTKTVEPSEDPEEAMVLNSLIEAFASVSMEEATSAYMETNGDPNKAAEYLGGLSDDRASSSGSSSGSFLVGSSSSSSSDMYDEAKSGSLVGSSTSISEMFDEGLDNGVKGKPKKKVVATTGMVSSMLGKDYVRSMPKKKVMKADDFSDMRERKAESEQFLCSMLGDECELGMAVVSDVLCQCNYDVNRALNILLELSASSSNQPSNNGRFTDYICEDAGSLLESNEYLADRTSDSISHSSESELQDNLWSMSDNNRNYFKALVLGSEAHSSTSLKVSESELPQKVLESLFKTPRTSQQTSNAMNWKNVVRKIEVLGPTFKACISDTEDPKLFTHAKGDEYHVYRESARHHWDMMKSFHQKAAAAYTKGQRDYASYLSEQGTVHKKIARDADEKASQDIFQARNKGIENMITIDLHGQHVKQAMKLLKLHLLFGAYVRSVRWFKVITGCGSHGFGRSKLKESVINLLQKEAIQWSEENRGSLLIRLDGQTEFSFLDTDSDAEE